MEVWQYVSKALKMCFDPTILFLGIYPKNIDTHWFVQMFIYKEVYFVFFIVIKRLMILMSTIGELVKLCCYLYKEILRGY